MNKYINYLYALLAWLDCAAALKPNGADAYWAAGRFGLVPLLRCIGFQREREKKGEREGGRRRGEKKDVYG